MPDGLVNVFAIVLLLAAACYLLMPLVIKATQYLTAHPRYESIAPADLPPDVVAFMAPTETALRAEGFYGVTLLRSAGDVPGVTADVMLFMHVSTGDRAQVAFTRGGTLTTPIVTMETSFPDGYAVLTTNFADAGTFPRDPRKHRLSIPGMTDVAMLCEVHRRRRAAIAPPGLSPAPPPSPGHEVREQEQEDAQECARVAAAGYYRLDPDGIRYRPTFKGAYLMTWKLMWPVSALRRWSKRRAARRELSALGLDPALV